MNLKRKIYPKIGAQIHELEQKRIKLMQENWKYKINEKMKSNYSNWSASSPVILIWWLFMRYASSIVIKWFNSSSVWKTKACFIKLSWKRSQNKHFKIAINSIFNSIHHIFIKSFVHMLIIDMITFQNSFFKNGLFLQPIRSSFVKIKAFSISVHFIISSFSWWNSSNIFELQNNL